MVRINPIKLPGFIVLFISSIFWILWIKDMSQPDPYYILPVIYGITMFLQHKLNPTPMGRMQEKVMQIVPIGLTFLFAFFLAGLVIYRVVNNTLSIIQQSYITRVVMADKKPVS